MNETKEVWKDVAAILKESGWPENTREEGGALKAAEQAVLSPTLPSRKEPAYLSWLAAGAVTALVICFLASFLIVGSQQGKPRGQDSTALREEMEKIQRQMKVMEDAEVEIKRSLGKLGGDSNDSTSTSVDNGSKPTPEQRIKELQEDNQRIKEALKDALKAQEALLKALKEEKRNQYDSLNKQLKDR